MEAIRQYALSVISGGLLVSILLDLSGKSRFQKQLRLVCGIFFASILLGPLLSLSVPNLDASHLSFLEQSEQAAAQGEKIYLQSLYHIIQDQCQSYILKEAGALGAELEVQVELDNGYPPAPQSVTLRGSFDAQSEARLSKLLAEEFGIPKERQTWIRQPSEPSSGNTSTFF